VEEEAGSGMPYRKIRVMNEEPWKRFDDDWLLYFFIQLFDSALFEFLVFRSLSYRSFKERRIRNSKEK